MSTIGNLIQTAIDRALERYQPVLQLVRDTLPARALPPEGQDGSGGYPASPHDHDDRYYTKPQTDAEITDAIAAHEGAANPHAQYLLLSSVSLTPTPNVVPRAGVAGKLAVGWIPQILLDSMVSGTLPIANGGTGTTTAAAALTALGGVRSAGGVSSIQSGLDTAKPSPSPAGQLYISTDTQQVYRSTNLGWQIVASVRLADQLGEVSDAQHGTRSGGTLHATATPSVAGFMSAADKSKLDGVGANIAYLNAAQTWTAAQTFNAGATLPLGQDLRANGATRGVMERLIDVRGLNFADEHFRTGVATAGYTWRGAPFTVPPTIDYAANGDYLVVTPSNAGRHFFAKTISTFANRSLTIRAAPQHNALVGIRVDDGTDNNYYQAVLRFAGAGQMRFEMHQRTAAGSVSIQLGPTTMLGALLVFQLLSFQPAATHTPFMYIVNEVGFSSIMLSGIGVSWAAQRAGIVVQEGEVGTGFSFIDWFKNEHS